MTSAGPFADLVSCHIIIIAPAAAGVTISFPYFTRRSTGSGRSFGGRCGRKVQSTASRAVHRVIYARDLIFRIIGSYIVYTYVDVCVYIVS